MINNQNLETVLKDEERKELSDTDLIVDKVIEFFRDKVSQNPHKNLKEHLLCVL